MIEIYPLFVPAASGLAACFLLCWTLVLTKEWHGVFTLDDINGIQKFHSVPTPRIGGLGLACGLIVTWLTIPRSSDVDDLLGPMLLSGMPAFVFGIAEDLTKRIGVRDRLLATMASGILAWLLTGISITRIDVWGVDTLLSWLPLSIAFTAFAVGGVANAVNIIDGFNGLAAGTMIICLGGLGSISYTVGDLTLVHLCVVLMAVCLGFLLINFPLGKIFLGDGGAYLMGFLLAWFAVMLPMRNPGVSVWAPLLVCAYPLLEVIFSVLRKLHREGHNPGQPDRVHLHMLMYRRVIRFNFSGCPKALQNGLTSPALWVFSLMCGACANIFYQATPYLIGSFVFFAICYHLTYVRLTQFNWAWRVKRSFKRKVNND
jgi:UDP-N-acetylmuramyl pentapeptide phosphotransferase/UDP-N-acetylglucosamine-1-phosphate transferase